jgi:hypothetical protein
MTSKSKLATALRRKFKNPRALLRALGLDENLADVGNTAQPDVDGTKARVADFKEKLQQWLYTQRNAMPEEDGGLIARILAVLDQDVGEDEVVDLARFKAFFKGKGLSDADIEEALRLAQGGEHAADRLPLDGTRGGMGGYGHGSEANRVGRTAMDEATRSRVASEMDVLLGTGRVSIGIDTRQPRRPVSMPTARAVTDFNAMFPDAARLET